MNRPSLRPTPDGHPRLEAVRHLRSELHPWTQIQGWQVLFSGLPNRLQPSALELAVRLAQEKETKAMTSTGRRELFKAVNHAVNSTLRKHLLTDAEVIGVLILLVAQHSRMHLDDAEGHGDEPDEE